jgi:DNA-binding transcriptional LysR family regulator
MMDVTDLNDIRIFTVVGQEATLTSAALRLKLPTSTVSRALTRLEKSLDVLLISRSPRGLVLTDFGKEYLQICRRALRTLHEGSETLAVRRERPSGLIKVACPVTMAHLIFAPLLKELLKRYPELRLQIEPYTPAVDQEFREDIDVVFKVRAPGDSTRRMRNYPSTKRGLFASAEYIKAFGMPSRPEELLKHTCVGSGTWKLNRGATTVTPNIQFQVVTNDPAVLLELTLSNCGIALLPLYMGKWPETGNNLVPVLARWRLQPLTLCALFSGQSRLTPKVQVLLDFLGEYIGTARDPRLQGIDPKGLFADLLAER